MKRAYFLAAVVATLSAIGCSKSEDPNYQSTFAPSGEEVKSSTPVSNRMAPDGGDPAPGEKPVNANAAVQQRYVIRNATIQVRVKNAEEAEKRVISLLRNWGGYVESSTSTDLASDKPTLSLTLRVPVTRFDDAMEQFQSMGTLLEKRITGQDVTGQVVDLDARVRTMKATEESVRQLLGRARSLDDITSLREKLGQMRAEIESLMAQRKSLGELAALSTISLTLEQRAVIGKPSGDPSWAQEAWAGSTGSLTTIMREIGSFAIGAFVFSPLWLLPILAIWWSIRSWSKKQPDKPVAGMPFQT